MGGDSPGTIGALDGMAAVLRHGGGIDPSADLGAVGQRGSPARAGIDPTLQTRSSSSPRFPRTRGDRPYYGKIPWWKGVVLSHPQSAGIDPS